MSKPTLGSYLKNARTRAGLSQLEVAQKLNLKSHLTVAAWERNRGEALALSDLEVLISIYSLDPDVVLDLILQYQLSRIEQKFARLRMGGNHVV